MAKVMNSIYNLITTWQPLVYILVVASLFIIGGMCIIPSQESKSKGVKALPWVLIGCGLVLGAVVIAKEITGAFTF